MYGNDRCGVQVITAATRPLANRVRGGVPGSYEDQLQFRVIRQAVPDSASATVLPFVAGIPCLDCREQMRLILRTEPGITRDREEAPFECARIEVVGRNVAAHSGEVRSRISNHHRVPGDCRRAGHGIREVLPTPNERIHFPDQFARRGIDRTQRAVKGSNVNTTAPNADHGFDAWQHAKRAHCPSLCGSYAHCRPVAASSA